MSQGSLAVAQTLKYADQFQFPLTEAELRQYLIGYRLGPRPVPPGPYQKVGEYYMLRGREALVRTRKLRVRYTQEKIARAIKLSHLLRVFPGVRLVGLTGSVAASNASRRDDIDLMIVTSKNRIWLTRAIILGVFSLVGLKRPDKASGHFDNKFCFNLWLEETRVGLTMKNRDLYTAYEVCLMKPLLGGDTYRQFLNLNKWREKYLPNFKSGYGTQYIQDSNLTQDLGHVAQYIMEIIFLHTLGWLLEPVARYISKRRIAGKHQRGYHTGVTVTDHQLMFHPASPRRRVLSRMLGQHLDS